MNLPLRLAVTLCCVGSLYAEENPVPATPSTAAAPVPVVSDAPDSAPATALVVPANTVIKLELLEEVSSKTGSPGNLFRLRLAEPLLINGIEALPAGTPAVGEIVHAQKASLGGKAGELLLAARYLDTPQGRIKLRSSFGAAGKDHSNTALGVTVALGPVGLVVMGGNKVMPAGSLVSARIAADTSIAPPAAATAAADFPHKE